MVKIKWAPNSRPGQIYGSGVQMALCSADNEQIGTFVYCKDFFQDAIKGFLHDTKSSIYGYTYDPKTQPPIPLDEARILLCDSGSKDFASKLPIIKDFMNSVEKDFGLKPSTIEATEGHDALLIVGSKTWLTSPASLSAYTLLLRNAITHEQGQGWKKTVQQIINGDRKGGQSHDNIYLKFGLPGLKLMEELGITKVFGVDLKKNYGANIPTSTIHHYGGLVAFGSRQKLTEGTWPHWVYPKEKSNPPGVCFS